MSSSPASLPIIDLSLLREAATDPREVARLRAACEGPGFFYVRGHGVDPAIEARLEDATRRFFALPDARKQQVAMTAGGKAWRGWFPVGDELTSGAPDRKEGLYLGEELGPDDPRVAAGWPLHGRNLFPDGDVPELREAVTSFMAATLDVGQRVLEGIALALGLDRAHFRRGLTREPLCLFRIFHYPHEPASPAEDDGWGVGEHTDYGLLTLLKQDDCGGLEVRGREGWVDAPPIPGTFVCNLGDMLDRMTGGRHRSTPHRVRNLSGRSRYAWPFFLDPGFDAEVVPLPGSLVRPVEVDAADRWDRASVHDLHGSYGTYLLGKVAKVFPDLARMTIAPRR